MLEYFMTVRLENPTDLQPITEVHGCAFSTETEGRIVEKLRQNGNLVISLVCEIDDRIVGHIAYSPIFHENQTVGLGLGPVAVSPEYQRRGIGTALIEKGNMIAMSKGFNKIFVLGDTIFYSQFGFNLAKKYHYFSKFDPDGNHFMILTRDENALRRRPLLNTAKSSMKLRYNSLPVFLYILLTAYCF